MTEEVQSGSAATGEIDTRAFDPDNVGAMLAQDDDSLVFNLEGVSESGTFEIIPPGTYDAVIDNAEFGHSQRSNNPMITWIFTVPYNDRDRRVYFHTPLVEGSLPRLKRLLVRVDPSYPLAQFNAKQSPMDFIGKACRVKLGVRMYEGQQRNEVRDILPPAEGATEFLPA